MVKIIKTEIDKTFLDGRKVFCFGAGRLFDRFIDDNMWIEIEAVVDNYIANEYGFIRGGDNIKVIGFNKFLDICGKNDVVIITTKFYMDVIAQMDLEESLDNLTCYIYDWWSKDEVEIERLYNKLRYHREMASAPKEIPSGQMNFQIWNGVEIYYNAGTKAPQDIKNILEKCNFFSMNVRIVESALRSDYKHWQIKCNEYDWSRCNENFKDGSLVFLQHLGRQGEAETSRHIWEIKQNKKIWIITLIHDIEKLRIICDTPMISKEFDELLKYTDVFIVHNDSMKNYMEKQGVCTKKIVCLDIFDYLTSKKTPDHSFSRDIIIAGNFDRNKSGYVEELGNIIDIKFHLYGQNFTGSKSGNVIYHGAASPEDIIDMLPDGFGLVWDGPSIVTCTGNAGEYLRYNNPHKLSLYIVSGLPVIIWDKAAEREFVLKNNIGFVIKSLNDLPKILSGMTADKYEIYRNNVKRIAKDLTNGEYTKRALKKAEEMIDCMK